METIISLLVFIAERNEELIMIMLFTVHGNLIPYNASKTILIYCCVNLYLRIIVTHLILLNLLLLFEGLCNVKQFMNLNIESKIYHGIKFRNQSTVRELNH